MLERLLSLTDADVIAVAEDQLEAAIQVFYVRGGRVRGQRGVHEQRVDDVAVVESDPLRFVGFRALFDSEPDLELVSASMPELGQLPNVDLILLGNRNGQNLFDIMASLKAVRPDLRIIVTGSGMDDESVLKAIAAGAAFPPRADDRSRRRSRAGPRRPIRATSSASTHGPMRRRSEIRVTLSPATISMVSTRAEE